jgi:tRNA pseudouridine(55) synthase
VTLKVEIIELYKNLGETPLECILRFKRDKPLYKDTKMTYLGRLDPMAEGLLLVLAWDTRGKNEFLSLDKTYEFEVLWGFKSDTYDILGIAEFVDGGPSKLETKMMPLLKKISSLKSQTYPLFSSKAFGKDFLKAREANIDGVDLPERGIKIFSIDHIHTRIIRGKEILEEVERKITLVQGDFRQKEVLISWKKALNKRGEEDFLVSKFQADVSSGTYIRGLANDMGKILKSAGLAWSIKRTRVGKYKME